MANDLLIEHRFTPGCISTVLRHAINCDCAMQQHGAPDPDSWVTYHSRLHLGNRAHRTICRRLSAKPRSNDHENDTESSDNDAALHMLHMLVIYNRRTRPLA